MQRIYENQDKIIKIMASCKNVEQLTIARLWLDRIVNRCDLYDNATYSGILTGCDTALLIMMDKPRLKVVEAR